MSISEDPKGKINDLLKKAVSLGADVYFNAEDRVSKTLASVPVTRDFLRDNIKSLFESYKVQIVSELKLSHKDGGMSLDGGSKVVKKKAINSKGAPKAIGPYSQAVEKSGMIFLSGQIPLDPKSMEVVSGGVEEQTEQVFKNLKAVLEEADLSFEDVVRTTVYLKSMDDFTKVNAIYAKYFEGCVSFPARACVEVAKLPKGVLVEIDAIAIR